MKKLFATLAIVVLVASFITSMTVLASPSTSQNYKKNTPGAQATLNAIRKETPKAHGNSENSNNKKSVHYSGVISVIGTESITLTLDDQSTVEFVIDNNTQIKIPSLGNSASAVNLLVGQKVNIRATADDSGALIALSINVIPGKPVKVHRVGTVTEYIPGVSITITNKDGIISTFLLTDQTKILPVERANSLAIGSLVTIICPRDVTGGPLTALGIVIHPSLVEPAEEETGTETVSSTPTETATETLTPTITETPTETPTETIMDVIPR